MFEGPRLGGLSCLALRDLQRPARSSAEELGLGGVEWSRQAFLRDGMSGVTRRWYPRSMLAGQSHILLR